MKFVAFIMAVLVLAQSVMPCADAEVAPNAGKAKITKQSQQQSNNHSDACSPFCSCACCAGFSINHFIASIAIIPPYESNLVTGFLPSVIMEVALPIWQPPQIV